MTLRNIILFKKFSYFPQYHVLLEKFIFVTIKSTLSIYLIIN